MLHKFNISRNAAFIVSAQRLYKGTHMALENEVTIIGAGLAGCEAAWQAAKLGCRVTLCEMKPERFSPAHHSPHFAELVCSNSLKSNSPENASGVLKEELRSCGSLIMEHADSNRVPAGSALAVDRENFSAGITRAVESEPGITIVRKEILGIPAAGPVIVATGPLTSDAFAEHLQQLVGGTFLYFHDAISPIVEADSIDPAKTFRASRYDKGEADYINCPLSRDEYYAFIKELLAGEKAQLKDFETLVPYEGCMPIEVMAGRGIETLAFGPMKPVGLVDPHTGQQPYAVVQLRQENREATLYNMVGFQTRLKWPEQKRVFSMIAGLEKASFARYGSLHRNTYIHAPLLLHKTLQLKKQPRIFFAGQITGVEGYLESAAMGFVAGIQASRYAFGLEPVSWPPTTLMGSLLTHLTESNAANFQPMNANFGLLPGIEGKVKKKDRKKLLAERSLRDIGQWAKNIRGEAEPA